MTDQECVDMLRLLHSYVVEYGSSADMKISEMAEDLAMSMDVTTNEADRLRRWIEEALS
jgi:hypothetical protein